MSNTVNNTTLGNVDGVVNPSKVDNVTFTYFTSFTDDFARSDGALGNDWVFTTGIWTIASGAALGTPGLTGNLQANPDMELNSTWVAQGTPATCAQSGEQYVSGSNSWKVVVDAAYEGITVNEAYGTANKWHKYIAKVYGDASTNWYLQPGGAEINLYSPLTIINTTGYTFPASWTTETWTSFVTSTTKMYLRAATGNTTGTAYLDDVSIKTITLADMFAVRENTAVDVTCQVALTVPTIGVQAGVVVRLDSTSSPANYVIGYVNRTNATTPVTTVALDYWEGGVRTAKITPQTVTYGAGKILKVVVSGTTYKLYYDGTQKGSDQTINVAAINSNKVHGIFTTESTTLFDDFSLTAP